MSPHTPNRGGALLWRAPLQLTPILLALLIACGTNGGDSGQGPSDAGTDGNVNDSAIDASVPRPLCVNGRSTDGAYPKVDYAVALRGTLPDLAFESVNDDGTPATISLHDYYEPCAARARLLVLRVSAGWCGTCRWNVAHTGELLKLDVGPRLEILDLLVQGNDGVPPSPFDLAVWRARIDAPQKAAMDRKFSLSPASPASPLPLVILVDTRTMTVKGLLNDPAPEVFASRLQQEIAALDHAPQPVAPSPALFDGLFTRNRFDMVKEMAADFAPPPDTTNTKSDDPAAAALGKSLFGDKSLSPGGAIACATCHDPEQHFADGVPQSMGVTRGNRNAPSLTQAAFARWLFWDGRADSLWAQALESIEDAGVQASSRLFVAHAIADRYADAYVAIFGALPPLTDTARFPPAGKPGDLAWSAMASADRESTSRLFVNVGKALAAYERTLRVKPNALDAYAGGDLGALTSAEKAGLKAFFTVGCAQCHYGPRLTDNAFHVVRFPTGRVDGNADPGRLAAVSLLLGSEFLSSGPYSDDRKTGHGLAPSLDGTLLGAFKTPSLRGVSSTAPYGHGGTLATLTDVVTAYATAGLDPKDPRSSGGVGPWLAKFDRATAAELVPFLGVLSADAAP